MEIRKCHSFFDAHWTAGSQITMRCGELFDLAELRIPLSPDQKNAALHRIVEAARF